MENYEPNRVVVTDIHMTFWSMVVFAIKWTLASIPAIVILVALGAMVWGVVSFIPSTLLEKSLNLGTPKSVETAREPERASGPCEQKNQEWMNFCNWAHQSGGDGHSRCLEQAKLEHKKCVRW